jgi:hypothetical protein
MRFKQPPCFGEASYVKPGYFYFTAALHIPLHKFKPFTMPALSKKLLAALLCIIMICTVTNAQKLKPAGDTGLIKPPPVQLIYSTTAPHLTAASTEAL